MLMEFRGPFRREGDQYVVSTGVTNFHAIQDGLQLRGVKVDSAEMAMVAKNTVKVEGEDVPKLIKLMEVLEELDDVSKVFSNFDIDASQLAEAEA
jgi:transcriptional/translational regulatory protein YebC/TACO1